MCGATRRVANCPKLSQDKNVVCENSHYLSPTETTEIFADSDRESNTREPSAAGTGLAVHGDPDLW